MDKRQVGRRYRREAPCVSARLGDATTRQLAMQLHGSCTESTTKMTGRTLRWLREKGYVVTRRDGDSVTGELLVAVNGAGAKWLSTEGEQLPDYKTCRIGLEEGPCRCPSVFVRARTIRPHLSCKTAPARGNLLPTRKIERGGSRASDIQPESWRRSFKRVVDRSAGLCVLRAEIFR